MRHADDIQMCESILTAQAVDEDSVEGRMVVNRIVGLRDRQ